MSLENANGVSDLNRCHNLFVEKRAGPAAASGSRYSCCDVINERTSAGTKWPLSLQTDSAKIEAVGERRVFADFPMNDMNAI